MIPGSDPRALAAVSAKAVAPASVGNVGVGFDVLGHALAGPFDTVSVRRIAQPEIRISAIRGTEIALPLDAENNTAGTALLALREALGLSHGFDVEIDKGIPLSAGMGGSAASAAAAVVAGCALLRDPLNAAEMLEFAMAGEAVASGARHADNVAPSLFGGMLLVPPDDLSKMRAIPVPVTIQCVLVYPHLELNTRDGRAALRETYTRAELVAHSVALAGFVSACHADDAAGVRDYLQDKLIEPQRAAMVPGFDAAKAAALSAGALGCSLSGSGPSMFAWCELDTANQVAAEMRAVFTAIDVTTSLWISPVPRSGAMLVDYSDAQ